jgi:hypothetical protein
LTLDQVRRRFIHEGLRYMPGAQAMPCELRRIEPGRPRESLHDVRHQIRR